MKSAILFFSDDTKKTTVIKKQIVSVYPDIPVFTSPADAAATLDTDTNYLFLYCFNNCQSADQARLQLFLNSNGLMNIRHKHILLCDQKDSKFAYRLCKEMLFDFFITSNPNFNPYELILYLDKNMKLLELKDRLMSLTESITLFEEPQDNLFFKNKTDDIAENEEYISTSSDHISLFEESLNNDFSEFSNELETERYQPLVDIKKNDEFKDSFKKDVRSIVHNRLSDLNEQGKPKKNKHVYFNEYLQKQKKSGRKKEREKSNTESHGFILVIDHETTIRDELSVFLSQNNFTPVYASNAKDALSKMLSNMPSLVFISHQIKGMEASAFVRMGYIIHNDDMPPVIVYTKKATRENVTEFIKLGALSVLTLPLDYESLLDKIELVTNR